MAKANKKLSVNRKSTLKAEIFLTENGKTTFDESITVLKDNLLLFLESGKNVFQFESSISGEGKTTVVANVAVSLAKHKKKVVVVDLDFRNAGLSNPFGLSDEKGLGDYFYEDMSFDDLIKTTEYGVDVITVGKEVKNPSLALSSDKMVALIEKLRATYEFVLLDCSPILTSSDYMHVSKISDGVILVVSTDYVKKSAAKESVRLLEKLNVTVLGGVMTFVPSDSVFYGK
ncbi:MAG: CpsD/CapB family tyrosine-protein kinase [Clostridia bacterium]|nr:CpsD/CapB family tyrosine-protein kinase [Clostridia bacterium]